MSQIPSIGAPAPSKTLAAECRSGANTATAALRLTEECRLLAFNAALEAITVPAEDRDIVHLLAEMEVVAAQVRGAVEAFAEAQAALAVQWPEAQDVDLACGTPQDVLQ